MGFFKGIDNEMFFIPCIILVILMSFMIFLHYYSEKPIYKKSIEIMMILFSNIFSIYIGYLMPNLSIGTLAAYYVICIIHDA